MLCWQIYSRDESETGFEQLNDHGWGMKNGLENLSMEWDGSPYFNETVADRHVLRRQLQWWDLTSRTRCNADRLWSRKNDYEMLILATICDNAFQLGSRIFQLTVAFHSAPAEDTRLRFTLLGEESQWIGTVLLDSTGRDEGTGLVDYKPNLCLDGNVHGFILICRNQYVGLDGERPVAYVFPNYTVMLVKREPNSGMYTRLASDRGDKCAWNELRSTFKAIRLR